MKRSQQKFETSITLSTSTRDKLKKIRDTNEEYKTYDEVITDLLDSKQGFVDNYEVIKKPRVALIVNSIAIKESGEGHSFDALKVYYDDLKQAPVGKVYSPKTPDTEFYSVETAEVIYKTDDFILVRIHETLQLDQLQEFDSLVGVELL